MKITINGPAAAGKGTIARAFAQDTGIQYVDLGLVFRVGAFALITKRIKYLTDLTNLIQDGIVSYTWEEGKAKVYWAKEDITILLLQQSIAEYTSQLSADLENNLVLTTLANHFLATHHDVICDGRNAGTSILGTADYKFHATAATQTRALRRLHDIIQHGENSSFAEVLNDIIIRDQRDKEREINPLVIPQGAIILQTDSLSLQQSVQLMRKTIYG